MTDEERTGERLQKVLARIGIGSRRVCENLIAEGRVTVNGEVADLGRRVTAETDEVAVNGKPDSWKKGNVKFTLKPGANDLGTVSLKPDKFKP